jgi:tRNA dimethylallyltransferase
MLDAGLVEEVARLRDRGLTPECQAFRSVGVPETCAYLDGALTRDELVDRVVRATWALARRQMAWFRGEAGVSWIGVTGRDVPAIAGEIAESWRREVGRP